MKNKFWLKFNYVFFVLFFCLGASQAKAQSLYHYYLDRSHHYTYINDYERAIFYAEKAIARYPDSARCYMERGGAYFFAGNLDSALLDLNKSVKMAPKNREGYFWRGKVYESMYLYKKAELDYLKCLELDPLDELARVNLADVFYTQHKFTESEKTIKIAIKDFPNNPRAYNLLGLIYEHQERLEESIEQFTKGISVEKEFSPLYYNRARLYMATGHQEKACADWSIALELGAEDAEMWMDINNCQNLVGLSDLDKEYDKQELFSGSSKEQTKVRISADYFPVRGNARCTYVADIDGSIDTAVAVIRHKNTGDHDFFFDTWNHGNTDIKPLYFELMHTQDFRYTEESLELLMRGKDRNQVIPVSLFPRDFIIGEKVVISNTWNPSPIYETKTAAFSIEGKERYELPNGQKVDCVKMRVELASNNGKNTLSYLWLVKGFGVVKWRNSTGNTWEIMRYAIPEYGSFPESEEEYLLPPPPAPQIIYDEIMIEETTIEE